MINRIALKPQVWNLFFLKCSFLILLYVSMFKMTLRRFDKKWLLDNIIYFISLNQLHFYNHFNCHKYKKFSQWQKKDHDRNAFQWEAFEVNVIFKTYTLRTQLNIKSIHLFMKECLLQTFKPWRGEGTGYSSMVGALKLIIILPWSRERSGFSPAMGTPVAATPRRWHECCHLVRPGWSTCQPFPGLWCSQDNGYN